MFKIHFFDVIAKLEGVGDDKQAEGLLVRGRPIEKGSNSKHGRSKSRYKDVACFYCKKKGDSLKEKGKSF